MNNDEMFNKLGADRQQEIMNRINRDQLAMGNTVINADAWKKLGPQYRSMLLEKQDYFNTMISYVYTLMLVRAAKYRNEESKKYAYDLISTWFNLGGFVSNKKYALLPQQRTAIEKALDAQWSK